MIGLCLGTVDATVEACPFAAGATVAVGAGASACGAIGTPLEGEGGVVGAGANTPVCAGVAGCAAGVMLWGAADCTGACAEGCACGVADTPLAGGEGGVGCAADDVDGAVGCGAAAAGAGVPA